MKRLTFTLIILATASTAMAQWTTVGGTMYNANTGNIGIGTTNPIGKLQLSDGSTIATSLTGGLYSSFFSIIKNGAIDSYLMNASNVSSERSVNGMVRARGTLTNPLAVQNNDLLGTVLFGGFDGSQVNNGAGLFAYADGNAGSGYSPARLSMVTGNNSLDRQERMTIRANGNVGIATTSPMATFQVGGWNNFLAIGSAGAEALNWGTSYIGFNAARNNGNWTLKGDGFHNGGGVMYTNVFGDIFFAPIAHTGAADQSLTDVDVRGKIAFHITPTGVVRAKKIRVELTGWPDFVFKPNYKLPTLTEVKAYIDKNQHLPDMPSAEEVETNGLDLGEMNRLLLKKVEELTLYLIEKDQKEKQQRQEIDQLKKTVDSLNKKMNSISK